jgi:hypothetical protein
MDAANKIFHVLEKKEKIFTKYTIYWMKLAVVLNLKTVHSNYTYYHSPSENKKLSLKSVQQKEKLSPPR